MLQEEFEDLLKSIRNNYDYDFTEYAEASIKRRVVLFMNANKLADVKDLKTRLLSDEHFFEKFVQNASVTVTEMFRDPSFYASLRKKVMPRLATYPVIKVWLAGCATGEEVYSIAILLKEAGLLDRSIIYATDINQNSLKVAKEGIYPLSRMKDYTSNYIMSGGKTAFSDYYNANFDAAIMKKNLKDNLVFSAHNLTADRSFNEFQLIVCRNVLIYFNQNLQNRILNLFYESLCMFGFLGLGNKESLLFTDKKDRFNVLDRKEKIYTKIK